jgi:hypothetical protein
MTTRQEDLKPEALVQGLVGREAVRIVTAEMLGDAACKVVYRGQDGALADGFDEASRRYSGLRAQQASSTRPTSLTGYIVKDEVALAQIEADRTKPVDPAPPGPGGGEENGTQKPHTNEGTGPSGPGGVAPPPPPLPPVPPKAQLPTRYVASVKLDPTRASLQMSAFV